MSRSMKECNEKIFKKIYDFIFEFSDHSVDTAFKRCIKTTDNDKEFLKKARIIDECVISINSFFLKIVFEENIYIISAGFSLRHILEDSFTEIDLNAGLISLVLGETSVRLLDTSPCEEIVDKLLYQGRSKDEVLYVDYTQTLPYFPKIHAFSCDHSIDNGANAVNFSVLFLLWNPKNLYLEYSKESLSSIETIVGSFDNVFPARQVLYALTSSKWEHAFLEIYRCIEFFYDDFIMHQIYAQSRCSVPYFNFTEVYKNLPIPRPREKEIIKLMFETLHVHSQAISAYHASITHEKSTPSSAASWIYELRNCIVHSRNIDTEAAPIEIDWNIVLCCLANIILGLNNIFKPLMAGTDASSSS